MLHRSGYFNKSVALKLVQLAAFAMTAAIALPCLVTPASAIEVQCIEASRYEKLNIIFGQDSAKFAQYLGVRTLPAPDACRALLITGEILAPSVKDPRGKTDFDVLAEAIAANHGAVATLYLSSGGGSVGMGMRLAQLTRALWLKTVALEDKSFVYVPDFFASTASPASDAVTSGAQIPTEFAQGWRDYQAAVQSVSRIDIRTGRGHCASACTYLHVAGIDRRGRSFVHRARATLNAQSSDVVSLLSMSESMQTTENDILALYNQMDSGPEVVRLYKETATQTVAPAEVPRTPRYIADVLRGQCKIDVNAAGGASIAAERCVTQLHEAERSRQFAKMCPKNCDLAALLRFANERNRPLLAGVGQQR